MTNPSPVRTGSVFLTVEDELDDYRRAEAREVYETALGRIQDLAVQEQVMPVDVFDEMMHDKEFAKIELFDPDGNMVGLSAMTWNLEKIPLVAIRFFEKKYPGAKIVYVPFVAIPESFEGAFTALIEYVFKEAARACAVVALDAWDGNVWEDGTGFIRAIEAWTIRLSLGECSADYLGAQHHFAFDPTGSHGPRKRRLPAGMGVRKLKSTTTKVLKKSPTEKVEK
jgi:hypothetical protein